MFQYVPLTIAILLSNRVRSTSDPVQVNVEKYWDLR